MFAAHENTESLHYVVFVISILYQSAMMYIKFGLLLRLTEKKATFQQKIIISSFCGIIAILFIDLPRLYSISFNVPAQMAPFIISIPGIIITTICGIFCMRTLKLTPLRTLEVTVYSYLYFQTVSGVGRIISSFFITQYLGVPVYSTLIFMYITNFIVLSGIYKFMSYILTSKPHLLIIKSGSDTKPSTNVAFSIFQLLYVYFCASGILVLIPDSFVANIISLLLLSVFTALSIVLSNSRYAKAEIQDKETHIQSLSLSLSEFSAVKHDFFNILQTYNGYLELGDLEACKRYHQSLVEITTQAGGLLDLSRRAVENPALISLFLNKNGLAEKKQVKLTISVMHPLNEFPIEDIDLCRIVSCLLDNAIEAADASKEKAVALSIEKRGKQLMITITNSIDEPINIEKALAAGATSKPGHEGLGLVNVQRIIGKYPHCAFKMKCEWNMAIASVLLDCSLQETGTTTLQPDE